MNRHSLLWSTSILMTLCLTACGPSGPASGQSSQRPPTQVVAIEASRQPVVERLSLIGTLQANEQVEIKSEIDGAVERINFDEGESVDAGQLLVQLDESKTAASLAEAEANYQLSKTNYERAKQLHEDQLISRQEFDQAAASFSANEAAVLLHRRMLRDTRILAPFDGIVGTRQISPGQVISRNSTLTWLVDLDPVKVEINVPERFLGELKPGQELDLNVAAWPGETFHGNVFFIAPFVNPETRTGLVKARIPNPDHKLKPGMFASLEVSLSVREDSIVIPEVAINQVLEGNRANIMVVDADNHAQVRQIQVGLRLDGRAEVLEGLESGEQVIVEGLQKVFPGAPVVLAPPESKEPYLQQTGTGESKS